MTTYRITALRVQNFKRLHEVRIRPEADAAIVLIGGKNANGKSSILDALTAVLGGKKQLPADPVRHGADEAVIELELNDGDLAVSRRILPDGDSQLEVRDRHGALRAPQQMLDKLVSGRFLDPLAFLQLPAKEQRARLMTLIPDAARIDVLNEKRQRAFDRRTEVGRDLTKAEGELARTPLTDVSAPVDITAITAKIDELGARQRAGYAIAYAVSEAEREERDAKHRLGVLDDRAKAITAEIERLTRELNGVETERAVAAARFSEVERASIAARERLQAAGAEWAATGAPRRAQLDAELAGAAERNRAVYAAEAQRARHQQVAADVERLTAERLELTNLLATIDTRKADILAAAKLPVDGLSIGEASIVLNGAPFEQASDAERWRVALALAIAAAPDLADIWMRRGVDLDEDSMALVAEQAAAAGRRLWVEVVSTAAPDTIVIRDGRVAGKTAGKPRAKSPPTLAELAEQSSASAAETDRIIAAARAAEYDEAVQHASAVAQDPDRGEDLP